MTLFNFNLLTNSEQVAKLYTEATYIGKRKIDCITVVLYQLESFYVEIYYKKYRQTIKSIQCFTSTDQLEPYLKEINIEEALKVENIK